MPCDVNELPTAAACFQCLPPGSLNAVKVHLMCLWAEGPVTEELRITEDSETRITEDGIDRIIE